MAFPEYLYKFGLCVTAFICCVCAVVFVYSSALLSVLRKGWLHDCGYFHLNVCM